MGQSSRDLRILRILGAVFLCIGLGASVPIGDPPARSSQSICDPPERISFQVKRAIRRSERGFTEGLVFHDGGLYESTGEYGNSTLARIDVSNGEVSILARLPGIYFGEGLDFWNGGFLQLTWKENTALEWKPDFSSWPATDVYPWQGWGLTHDGAHWIASDGTSTLRFLRPIDLGIARSIAVKIGIQPVEGLNELEFRNGKILANVFPTKEIVRIDPSTGCVDGVLNLSALDPYFSEEELASLRSDPEAVANGIAFDPSTRLTYVTGKNWPLIFELVY